MSENKIIIKAIVLPQQKYLIDKPAWFPCIFKKNDVEIKHFPFITNDFEGFEFFRVYEGFIDGYIDENGKTISVAEYKDKIRAIYPNSSEELTRLVELQLEIEAAKHTPIIIKKIERQDIEFAFAYVPCLENKYIQPIFHLVNQSFQDAYAKINICHYLPNAKEMIEEVCRSLKISFSSEVKEGYSLSHSPLKFDKLNGIYVKYEREYLNESRFITVEESISRYENDMNMIKRGIQLALAQQSKDPLSKTQKGEMVSFLVNLKLKVEEIDASRKTQATKSNARTLIANKINELTE